MKSIIVLLTLLTTLFAVEIELRDGTIYHGDLIHQTKGKMIFKSKGARLSFYKKSIKRVDSTTVMGKRKFMLPDSLILKERHEILFVNSSTDSVTIKLRNGETGAVLTEKRGASQDTILFPVADGLFSETVKYWNDTTLYYSKGRPFEMSSKLDKFIKQEIELKGYPDGKAPTLKSLERAYDKK